MTVAIRRGAPGKGTRRMAAGAAAPAFGSAPRDLRALVEGALPVDASRLPRVPVTGLAEDSRRVRPGTLFVAVPGVHEDGARYAADAARRGAVAVVAERTLPVSVPTLVVGDARAAGADLAAEFHGRPAGALACAGITGTKGKTTTSFLLQAALEGAGRRTGLVGTVEVRIGERRIPAAHTTPGALELQAHLAGMVDEGCTHAVLEVSSHALAQGRTRGIPFRVCVLTNLASDHMDYHGSPEEYRAAKARLFEDMPEDSVAAINDADPNADWFAARARGRVLRYGFDPGCAVGAEDAEIGPDGVEFTLRVPGGRARLRSPLLGRHNIDNILAAAAGAHGLGLPVETITSGLGLLAGVPGRLERVDRGDRGFRVLVDYAHTEDSLRRVLGFLRPVTPGRLLVLGGCGGDRDRTKRPRMARAMAELADEAVFTSDNPRTEDPLSILAEMASGVPAGTPFTVIADRREAIAALVGRARPGDTLLIAGKGHENTQDLGSRTVPFDDREEARRALGIARAG
ncbi:MAG TPA: UDP-N-acetylmuramoyl-L-alanyl-D-glutamate--2,6-diaminopimelate ligase [Planctomycetota bacterium]|nr:UDP-N-acetylmuramoyl-L-alanyl-D-glutamate--2,6-diaminopimelate ligase [Planctomycetota bacterium]